MGRREHWRFQPDGTTQGLSRGKTPPQAEFSGKRGRVGTSQRQGGGGTPREAGSPGRRGGVGPRVGGRGGRPDQGSGAKAGSLGGGRLALLQADAFPPSPFPPSPFPFLNSGLEWGSWGQGQG